MPLGDPLAEGSRFAGGRSKNGKWGGKKMGKG